MDGQILSVEHIFDVLTAPERRAVLYVLCKRENTMSVDDLSSYVASDEIDFIQDSSEQIATSLHHLHLPKLEQFSLVEYDRDSNTVTANGLPRRLKRYLQITAADEMEACSEDATTSERTA
ncbi:DUF7344 domain-containing protein [Haladaptatus cibarius]|uniref:DUF7344 domain-containing protein n=1 Tax=Haladaptatus cibarius TaxID=453847 RepID=UPI0006784A81|nr:hypothetical protein [Haladaptatus cibarius]